MALRVHEVGVPYRDQLPVLVPVHPPAHRHRRAAGEPGVGLLGDVHVEAPHPDPVSVANRPEVTGVVARPSTCGLPRAPLCLDPSRRGPGPVPESGRPPPGSRAGRRSRPIVSTRRTRDRTRGGCRRRSRTRSGESRRGLPPRSRWSSGCTASRGRPSPELLDPGRIETPELQHVVVIWRTAPSLFATMIRDDPELSSGAPDGVRIRRQRVGTLLLRGAVRFHRTRLRGEQGVAMVRLNRPERRNA